jgi:two-component system response regulator PilR (NtrC family)
MLLDADTLLTGASEQIRSVAALVKKVRLVRSPVVIFGECGTGASTLAEHIHADGPTKNGPFRPFVGSIDALSLREMLDSSRGGSVYFEHVTQLDHPAQRVLVHHMRHSGVEEHGPRIFASTEIPLSDAIRDGRFAEELYYHLTVFEITLPALRERPLDISPIVRRMANSLATEMGLLSATVPDSSISNLLLHSYPGNLIELSSILERALALSRDGTVLVEHLPQVQPRPEPPSDGSVPGMDIPEEGIDLDVRLGDYERLLIGEALLRTGGNRTEAAKLLGISFRSLRYRLAKVGMDTGPEEG